jgi:hypothetical protein
MADGDEAGMAKVGAVAVALMRAVGRATRQLVRPATSARCRSPAKAPAPSIIFRNQRIFLAFFCDDSPHTS